MFAGRQPHPQKCQVRVSAVADEIPSLGHVFALQRSSERGWILNAAPDDFQAFLVAFVMSLARRWVEGRCKRPECNPLTDRLRKPCMPPLCLPANRARSGINSSRMMNRPTGMSSPNTVNGSCVSSRPTGINCCALKWPFNCQVEFHRNDGVHLRSALGIGLSLLSELFA
jgi:hypothetical protein